MALSRFTDLILRPKTFWAAVALFIAGSVVPETIRIGATEVWIADGLTGLASLLITSLIFVSIAVIFRTAYEGWWYGYAEGLIKS